MIANSEEKPSGLSDTKLHKIQSAINRAIVELIDNARKDDGVDQVNDSADG